MVDHYGEESKLRFPTDGHFATFVFQNHGEAYNIMAQALATFEKKAPPLSILHIDHHDDMQLPGPGIESMKPGQCDPNVEDECPLHNDNQQLSIIVNTSGAINRTLWLYPSYKGYEFVTTPHTCVVGKATAAGSSYGRFSHRTVAGEWWGLEEGQALEEAALDSPDRSSRPVGAGFVCGSTPFFEAPGMDEHDPTRPAREPLDAYAPLAKYEYAQASLDDMLPDAPPRNPAVMAVRDVLHGDGSWFPPGHAWILDLCVDYLVERDETSDGNPPLRHLDQRRPLWQGHKHTRDWLCELTSQCDRILMEKGLEPPRKPVVTPEEISSRVAGVRRVLHALLPSRPALATIARSNQGAFTPLRWTMEIEDALLEMLDEVYGKQPTGVQYLRSAFGSHTQSVSTYERLEREPGYGVDYGAAPMHVEL